MTMTHTDLAQQLQDAIGQHGAWKLRLKTAMLTRHAPITATEAARCDCCAFGQWLNDPFRGGAYAGTVQHRVVSRIHAEFHLAAGRVVDAIECADLAAARTAFDGDFMPRSEHLVRNVSKWMREAKAAATLAA